MTPQGRVTLRRRGQTSPTCPSNGLTSIPNMPELSMEGAE
jgi:hypothetical protein